MLSGPNAVTLPAQVQVARTGLHQHDLLAVMAVRRRGRALRKA
jgi:hypothetical protein